MNRMIRMTTTGEMSMPPIAGSTLRIGRSTGSVDLVEEATDRWNHLIARVDHVERDQPAEDRRRDQH